MILAFKFGMQVSCTSIISSLPLPENEFVGASSVRQKWTSSLLNMSSKDGGTMHLRRALFSPTQRSKLSFIFNYAFPLFIFCSLFFFLFVYHEQQSPAWLKSVLERKGQFLSYFPHYFFDPNASRSDHAKTQDSYNSASAPFDGLRNETLQGSGSAPGLEASSRNGTGMEKPTSRPGRGRKKRGNKRKKRTKPKKSWLELMGKCDLFDGKWVPDATPSLYDTGSCPHIDESFSCKKNGRPDDDYTKFRWQPNHCTVPKLDMGKMLKLLKGKRIVYIGDSLNRNMWDSMVCMLINSVKNKSRVFEASGQTKFKTETALSFIFQDYDFSVEYIRSSFLVQEWETTQENGTQKETLRLDIVDKRYAGLGDADVLVFNTGNWWTHEKTSEGKDYYQEGDHVYEQLDVVEAFDKAMATWAKWMEMHVNPMKTDVFFRGYSFAHFSKGEWNTGGRCDSKEPIVDENELIRRSELSPPVPQMIDGLMRRLRMPVFYQNVTRMTNYRCDAHPSSFRKPNMTEDERRFFETHQDCSHWCLPGVPDTWNELLFAELLLSRKRKLLMQQHRT